MANVKKETEYLSKSYTQSLGTWQQSNESWKKAGEFALKQYANAMNLAWKQSDMEQINKYNEQWAKAWSEVGENPYKWYLNTWEKIWKESGFVSFRTFNEQWQKIWSDATQEVFKKYIKVLNYSENT